MQQATWRNRRRRTSAQPAAVAVAPPVWSRCVLAFPPSRPTWCSFLPGGHQEELPLLRRVPTRALGFPPRLPPAEPRKRCAPAPCRAPCRVLTWSSLFEGGTADDEPMALLTCQHEQEGGCYAGIEGSAAGVEAISCCRSDAAEAEQRCRLLQQHCGKHSRAGRDWQLQMLPTGPAPCRWLSHGSGAPTVAHPRHPASSHCRRLQATAASPAWTASRPASRTATAARRGWRCVQTSAVPACPACKAGLPPPRAPPLAAAAAAWKCGGAALHCRLAELALSALPCGRCCRRWGATASTRRARTTWAPSSSLSARHTMQVRCSAVGASASWSRGRAAGGHRPA